MPWGVAAAVGGSIAGSLVSSAMAPDTPGGSGGSGGGSYYVPTGLQTADQQWQGLQTGNVNAYNQNPLQQYGQQSFNQGMGVYQGYGPTYQNQMNNVGQQYTNLTNLMHSQAQQQGAIQNDLLDAGKQFYNTSLDPQNALYGRTVQQLQDQTGATNSMYGLGSSAAGAGVANQALGNFNIDWQNQQQQRQLLGLQGYSGAAQLAGQFGQQGIALEQQIPGYTSQAAQIPFQTAQNLAAMPGQLGTQYGQYMQNNVYGPAQGFQQQAIPYMNYGQGAQAVPYQNQLQGAGAAGAMVSQGVQGLFNNPQAQQGMSSAFGSMFGSGGGYGAQNALGYGGVSSAPYYSGGGNSYGFTM